MCICVCIHTWIYVHIYVFVHVHILICVYIHIASVCKCACTYACMCMCECLYVCVLACVNTWWDGRVPVPVHAQWLKWGAVLERYCGSQNKATLLKQVSNHRSFQKSGTPLPIWNNYRSWHGFSTWRESSWIFTTWSDLHTGFWSRNPQTHMHTCKSERSSSDSILWVLRPDYNPTHTHTHDYKHSEGSSRNLQFGVLQPDYNNTYAHIHTSVQTDYMSSHSRVCYVNVWCQLRYMHVTTVC